MDTSNQKKNTSLNKNMNSRERAALEAKKEQKKSRTRYAVIGAIIVVFIAAVILINSSLFLNGLPALKVNDTSYTVADANYAYQQSYISLYNNYGNLMSYLIDTSKPLDEQDCSIDAAAGSWHDYFLNAAKENLKQLTVYTKAAQEAGYTLSQEDQDTIDEALASYESDALAYGYTLDGFLAANFGEGNNAKTVRANLERSLLVENYLNDLYESFTYTDAEKEAYVKEHVNELTNVSYEYYYLSGSADEASGLTAEAAMADAEAKAEEILTMLKEDESLTFADAVAAVTDASVSSSQYTVDTFLTTYKGSVEAADVVPDAVFSHVSENGVYVVHVTGVEDNNYNTVSVRHILVEARDADGDGSISEAEMKTAYDAIEEIRNEWTASGGTEEAFASLANLKSEDPGSNTNGGLYENIYKGQMIENFDAFCFDSHKAGDTAIVEGDEGYHLIYFVSGDGEVYSHYMAGNYMQADAYTDATSALLDGCTATETGMWHYVMKQ